MPDASPRSVQLNRLSVAYFGLVVLTGIGAAGYVVLAQSGLGTILQALHGGGGPSAIALRALQFSHNTLFANPTFYLLLGLSMVAELTHIPLPSGGRMNAGFLISFAALLMVGLPAAILVASFASLALVAFHPGRPWRFAGFNIGQYTFAYLAANAALQFQHVYIPGFPGPDDYGHVALATAAYLVINFAIVDTYLGIKKGLTPWRILWEDDRTELLVTLALAPMALLMATMYASQEWWGISLVLIPLFATAYFVRLFIQLREAHAELAAYNQQLTILQEVATRISSQIDLEQTMTLISQEIRRVVGYHDCMIFLHDEKTGMLVRQLTADPFLPRTPLQVPVEHGVIGQVARERATLRKPDLAKDSLDVGVLSGYRSLLAVPIRSEQTVLGVLALLHRDASAFGKGDERLLTVLASQAAVAIKNAQLYHATQQLAVTDGLTKVYNRRYFEDQLTAELQRGARHGHTTSLILLDVDHFKKFNDTHGHLLGDHVLQGVARVLQKSTRETDLVARYGGEEFAVILPETPADAALEVAERIRRNVKAHPFWGRQQTPLQVTISVGLATDPSSSLEPRAIIDQADTSLYQAKKQGRDRVCRTIYSPEGPLEVTESRQDKAPEPTLRRPTRAVSSLSVDDWKRYLRGNLDEVFNQWWADPRVAETLAGARDFWHDITERFVTFLLKNLSSTEEERNGWLEDVQRNPLYRPVQSELSRLIQEGASLTQMEHVILVFYKKTQAMVQGAPFSLEERMAVGAVQERLFHVLQLMVSQVWHDFFQATSEHLYMVSALESKLSADFEPAAVLEEIAALTAKALGADACLVMTPDGSGDHLAVNASWGLPVVDLKHMIPMGEGLAGQCFSSQEVLRVAQLDRDERAYRPFHDRVHEVRPVASGLAVPLVYQGGSLGVIFCLSDQEDHFSPLDARLAKEIGGRLATALARQRQEAERQTRYLEAISALAEALERREAATGRSEKLMDYAMVLAEAYQLPDAAIDALKTAGRLHDIGQLGIPDAVLAKPAPLDQDEQQLVRSHPLMGAKILGYIEALRDVVPIVRHHHERMDGSGYPDGLKGEEIPLLARILAVADAFDAMTSPRPYRQAMTPEQAFHELRRSRHYDAEVLDRLEKWVKAARS